MHSTKSPRTLFLALLASLSAVALLGSCGGDGGGGGSMCVAPAADCDGDPSNACETTLGTRANCAACGEACDADAYCSPSGCAVPAFESLFKTGARIRDIAYGDNGHLYVTGEFSGAVDFGSGEVTATGTSDVFVAHYDSSYLLVWANFFGSSGVNSGLGVDVDADGNAYATGYVSSAVDLGDGIVRGADADDVFVVSYDVLGGFRWGEVYASQGGNQDQGRAIVVSASGDVFVAGNCAADIDLGGGARGGPTATDRYVFVAAYDGATGAHQFSRVTARHAQDFTSYVSAHDLAVDSNDNVYVVGEFRGTADFEMGWESSGTQLVGDTEIVTGQGFVSSFTGDSGAYRWHRILGGESEDHAAGVAVDAADNVYVTGAVVATPDFGAGDVTVTPDAAAKVFIASYAPSNAHRWAVVAANAETELLSQSFGGAIAVSGGNVYVAGSFTGTVDFGGGEVVATPSGGAGGTYDPFLLSVGTDTGSCRFLRSFGGIGDDYAEDLDLYPGGIPFIAARVTGAVTIDGTLVEPVADTTYVVARLDE